MQRQIPLYQSITLYHPPQTKVSKHKVKGGQFLGASLKSAQAKAPLPFEITMHSTATPSIPNAMSSHPSLHHPPPFTQDPFPKRPFHMLSPTLTIRSAPRPINRDSHHRHAIMARLILFRTIVHPSVIVLPKPFVASVPTFSINSRTAPIPSHVRFDASMVCRIA